MKWISPNIREEAFVSPHDGSSQSYLLAEFQNSSIAAQPLLVLYLHGAGSHQDQGMTAEIYNDAFGRLARWMSGRNAIYICPEYRGSSWMSSAAEDDVREIVRIASDRYRPNQILLIGGSMGGTSALIFASRNPGVVDAVLAFCPATDMVGMFAKFSSQLIASYGGTPDEIPEVYRARSVCHDPASLADQRLTILHGTADATMPVGNVRDLVATLREGNAPVNYFQIEGGGHDAPLFADFLPQLDWLVDEQSIARPTSA